MASTENGTTRASPVLRPTPTSKAASFDSGDRGATRAGTVSPLRAATLSGFDTADHSATRSATPSVALPRPPATTTTYYKMRALDLNCAPAKTYRTWVVMGSPDTTGAQYVGARCGASVNFADIVVEDTWQV